MWVECVCEDCGINVPFEDQYVVKTDSDGISERLVCPECAKKYGYNLDGKNTKVQGWN